MGPLLKVSVTHAPVLHVAYLDFIFLRGWLSGMLIGEEK